MELLFAALWSFGASALCAVVFNAGKHEIVLGGLLGAVGWTLYLYFSRFLALETLGYLAGAFCVALFAEILAYAVKNPATVFLLPGLLPLVPGGGMFQTMRELVTGNRAAAADIGYKTLMAAGAIALGIAIASSTARLISLAVRQWYANTKKRNKS